MVACASTSANCFILFGLQIHRSLSTMFLRQSHRRLTSQERRNPNQDRMPPFLVLIRMLYLTTTCRSLEGRKHLRRRMDQESGRIMIEAKRARRMVGITSSTAGCLSNRAGGARVLAVVGGDPRMPTASKEGYRLLSRISLDNYRYN